MGVVSLSSNLRRIISVSIRKLIFQLKIVFTRFVRNARSRSALYLSNGMHDQHALTTAVLSTDGNLRVLITRFLILRDLVGFPRHGHILPPNNQQNTCNMAMQRKGTMVENSLQFRL